MDNQQIRTLISLSDKRDISLKLGVFRTQVTMNGQLIVYLLSCKRISREVSLTSSRRLSAEDFLLGDKQRLALISLLQSKKAITLLSLPCKKLTERIVNYRHFLRIVSVSRSRSFKIQMMSKITNKRFSPKTHWSKLFIPSETHKTWMILSQTNPFQEKHL